MVNLVNLMMGSKSIIGFSGLLLVLLWSAGCGDTADKQPIDPANAPKVSQEESGAEKDLLKQTAARQPEGSGGEVKDHPDVQQAEKLQREVRVPENVAGKWKSVKILIRNKADDGKNELKTVALGSGFQIGDSGLKVTVGPFLPNFVMDQGTYTSMNNQAINPAVQLVVEENGKVLYKGWTFAKYPEMYAFEHDKFALELKDYIPEDVS
ncbi:hypothetical protein MNBD_NITROSPINAE05-746 [hydrothermal vent metagenome]|uniref:DUF2155 domain-containing protein n=1 Tax=hydrothermal vent metagenome TaxID=652676 RepID=A0A3B1CPA9_9ZZZZ